MDTVTVPDQLRALLSEFETRAPTDPVKVDDELVHTICGQVLCDVQDRDALSALVDTAAGHTCPDSITLGLHNRPEVIAFIDGEFHPGREPDDPGSDVVVIDLIDRSEVVINGETVTRTDHEFLIGRAGKIRTTFPRIQ
jgi:hypothetical protein